MKIISIADDFTKYPGGRYRKHGKGSGEEFRDSFLVPLLEKQEEITVILDGTAGYSSSFLEEAFGGLVRRGYEKESIRRLLKFRAEGGFKAYERMIWSFVDSTRPSQLTVG